MRIMTCKINKMWNIVVPICRTQLLISLFKLHFFFSPWFKGAIFTVSCSFLAGCCCCCRFWSLSSRKCTVRSTVLILYCEYMDNDRSKRGEMKKWGKKREGKEGAINWYVRVNFSFFCDFLLRQLVDVEWI